MLSVVFTAFCLSLIIFFFHFVSGEPYLYSYSSQEERDTYKQRLETYKTWKTCSAWFTILFALWASSLIYF